MTKFLVIVFPPPPATRGDVSTTWSPNAPTVKWVTAQSDQKAVEQVTVAPGGHALVVREADISRFDRAKQAPLEKKQADGSALPQVMERAA